MEQKFAVIGYPLGHTMSPFIHRKLFAKKEIEASYTAKEIPPQALAKQRAELAAMDGFNVTIPHKEAMIPLLDGLDDRAALYGAVNTVRCRGGKMTGYNTDCAGFLRALSGGDISFGDRVAVLGAGGAARMMVFEAAVAKAAVTIAVRPSGLARAQAVKEEAERKLPGASVSLSTLSELSGAFSLLCNATPCGMFPRSQECPIAPQVLDRVQAVFDAIYNPARTVLLQEAEKRGIPAVGGMPMLVWQAAVAQELWFSVRFTEEEIAGVIAQADEELRRRSEQAE